MDVIRYAEAQVLRSAVRALKKIYDRGYVDYSCSGNLQDVARQLDEMLDTYEGCAEKPDP